MTPREPISTLRSAEPAELARHREVEPVALDPRSPRASLQPAGLACRRGAAGPGVERPLGRSQRALGVVLGLSLGCASAPPPAGARVADPPTWVRAGSVATPRGLQGVGSGQGIRSPKLALQTAEARAKAELVALIQRVVTSAEPCCIDYSLAELEEIDARRSLSRATLARLAAEAGARVAITEVWTHPVDGTLWARAELPWSSLDEAIATEAGEDPMGWLRRLQRELAELRVAPP